ncbi:MAG: hypothetical protein HN392_11205 [Anaerolineae bacterium]|jgi:predicted outer membrane repeat protein|nr:hypothetical protein [Anaerolineae bacterium]MBT7783667.1 hypothetical protein [Anaerolineae bacterium]
MKSVLNATPIKLISTFLILALLLVAMPAQSAQAATITVSTCDEASLKTAISNAISGDTITISCSGTIVLTSIITIDKDLTIEGSGADQLAISGNNTSMVFRINGSTLAEITGLTIQNGYASDDGGGLANAGTLTLTDVNFSNNSAADNGGGLYNFNGSVTLKDVTFSGNSAASSGGGAYNYHGAIELTNVVFFDNSATENGGGLGNRDKATLTDVIFLENTASGSTSSAGGGMYGYAGGTTTELRNTTFSGNSAAYGGGMFNYRSNPSLTNVTFSDNSATSSGGGLYNEGSTPTLTNVTFTDNSATTSGGGIYNRIDAPTLKNVIIANSTGGDCIGSLDSSSANNLIEDTGANACGLTNGANGNIIGTDPDLGPLQNNGGFTQTHALLTSSDAIDKGANCPADDQRGVVRPQRAACDIGAYEAGASILIMSSSSPSTGATLESLNSILVNFNEDALNDGSNKAANYADNYLLVERGANGSFDTLSCAGVVSDDLKQIISSATYTNNGGSAVNDN